MWPVGQAVKTPASHAVNIGSNPVRVTTQKQAADRSLPRERESSIPPLLFRFHLETLRWFLDGDIREEKPLDKDSARQYNTECSSVQADDIVGAD